MLASIKEVFCLHVYNTYFTNGKTVLHTNRNKTVMIAVSLKATLPQIDQQHWHVKHPKKFAEAQRLYSRQL